MNVFALPIALALAPQAGVDPLVVTLADKVAQPLPDAAIGDSFGSGFALDGHRLIVGAELDDEAGKDAGAAYVYRWVADNWRFQGKLMHSAPEDYDRFGSHAVLDGNTLVIAADDNGFGARSGSAYVFRRQNGQWIEEAHLTSSTAGPFDYFGRAMALEGDRLVVGAPEPGWVTGNWVDHGTVYVFERSGTTWSEVAKLRASDGVKHDHFGESVALQGDVIMAAAPGDDDLELNSGAAYVFTYDGQAWSEVAKILPTTFNKQLAFGSDVALSGQTLVVGATGDDTAGPFAGAAYVFEGSGASWSEVAKLVPDDLGGYYGTSVAVDSKFLVVGANKADAQGSDSGATYVYRRFARSWHPMAKLLPAESGEDDELGHHVAVEGRRVVTSSPLAAPEFWLPRAGAAYVFELDDSVEFPCRPAAHSAGRAARLAVSGSLSLADNDLVVAVFSGPANQASIFLYGPDHAQVPFKNGYLCIGGGSVGVLRIGPGLKLDAEGHAERALDFTSAPLGSGPGQVTPGSAWSFQSWFRDAAAGPGASNLSESVRLTFLP